MFADGKCQLHHSKGYTINVIVTAGVDPICQVFLCWSFSSPFPHCSFWKEVSRQHIFKEWGVKFYFGDGQCLNKVFIIFLHKGFTPLNDLLIYSIVYVYLYRFLDIIYFIFWVITQHKFIYFSSCASFDYLLLQAPISFIIIPKT